MNKFYFFVFALILAVTSCQKQTEFETGIPQGKETSLSVDISMVDGGAATRVDEDAQITFYLQAFYQDNFFRDLGTSTTGHFDVQLVVDKTFTLVAWADYDKGYYNTERLDAITVNYSADDINDEYRDAFAGCDTVKVTANSSLQMELKRPFARVNLLALDFESVFGTRLMPDNFIYTYDTPVYTTIDAITGNVSGESTETIQFTKSMSDYTEPSDTLLISYDYLLAPLSSVEVQNRPLTNFTISFESDEIGTIGTYEIKNIPYERNYQTNVYGNLITTGVVVKITVDDEWNNPDNDINTDDPIEEPEEMSLSDLSADNVPEGDTWIISDETSTSSSDFTGLKAAIAAAGTDRSITLQFPNLTSFPSSALEYAYDGINYNIVAVEAPKALTVGSDAFCYCSGLKSVSMPLVTTIGDYAFIRCTAFEAVDFPECTKVGDLAFYECLGATSINLPKLTSAGMMCCQYMTSLESAEFPLLATTPYQMLAFCYELKTVSLPALKKSNQYLLAQNTKIESITFSTNSDATLATLGKDMFYAGSTSTNVTLTIGAHNSASVSGSTLTVGSVSYTFKEIILQ